MLRQFVRYPFIVGAVAPSSRHLARAMADALDLAEARTVVELGPGTGALTEAVLSRLGPRTRYLAVERNPAFVGAWRERFPGRTIVEGSAADLGAICASYSFESVDCIVSGLPWPSFSDWLQVRALEEIVSVLRPGGQLTTFGYHVGTCMPSGRRFVRMLPERFT
ncbi:MAG: methyltransferase domain-containing protein, partial [Bryobacteraceae bacterium]|nr:methyltransferase domain-containing protein [Bryobacteraceae bacterium]